MKKEQLEKQVLLSRGKWQFDRQVAAIFDRHIRRSVPLYDELHRMIVELAEPFLSPNAVVCDLGTSTGEAVFNLNKHYQKLELCYYAVDNSPAMLAKAREKCQAVKKVNFICSDLSDFSPPESDLIISLYTLQFVKPRERKLIQKKYSGL